MRKWIACLCTLSLLSLPALPALAEPVVYTGASGFTLTLPDDWEALIGGEEEEDDFFDDFEIGDEEALFSSGDGVMSVTVYYADDRPVDSHTEAALLSEPALEARKSGVNGYQKIYYRYDEPNRRAFISYSYIDSEEGVAHTEYLVGFITGSDIAQYLKITVEADQLETRFSLIGDIVNNIDVGGVREGAEG